MESSREEEGCEKGDPISRAAPSVLKDENVLNQQTKSLIIEKVQCCFHLGELIHLCYSKLLN